jgi:hypothetical protein
MCTRSFADRPSSGVGLSLGEAGTPLSPGRCPARKQQSTGEMSMGRGLLLWVIGIPLPVILLLYFLGYLH